MVNTKSPPAINAGEDATVSYLLSRVLSGGKICRATELAACLPRWFSYVKENKPTALGSPELLCRLLLPFGTPDILEQIESLQTSDSLTDRQRWMVKLRVLMDDKAEERLLQKLESLQDQELSLETLCEQENGGGTDDYLVADPKRTLQFDYDMRDVMIRGDKSAMRKNQDVFYVTGSVAWTVRSPYWNVALATDSDGNRYLSDDVLDAVLPKWRQILTGETVPTPKYGVVDSFRLWLASEEKKASDLGKIWPSTPVNTASSAPRRNFITPEPYSRYHSFNTARFPPFDSTPKVTGSEQTELLRAILTEVKELKTIVGQILERKQDLETTENQMHDSLPQSYPPIPPAMQPPAPPAIQPNYFMSQGQLVGSQYQLESDLQQSWNSQYQGPTTMPGPGPSSAHRL